MQDYVIIKLTYDNKPFPRWVVGDKDFGALSESQDMAIDFLVSKNASPDCIKFEYVGAKPAREDFENMFREKFRTKLKGMSV